MINEEMFRLGDEPNAIRALFAYGMKRKEEIGADKVFDFSIGNPSTPPPAEVLDALRRLSCEAPPSIHGYTPGSGAIDARSALAGSINERFDRNATAANFYLTTGAASSLRIAFSALGNKDDEYITITPYFPEYKVWIESVGCTCVEVPARQVDFQLDIAAIAAAISEKTKAIVLNSPNNPTGSVYPQADIEALSSLLEEKQAEFGTEIFIISDEPYREIVYDGLEVPFIPSFYKNTIVCYSYSKTFSLPGERIGYLYVSEDAHDWQRVYTAVCGAGRSLGYVCAPALFQQLVKECVDVSTDISPYEENRALLTEGLAELGYTFVEPQGAFYLWMQALEASSEAFSERARTHELLLAPSTSFACEGWVRIGYCTDRSVIEKALPVFADLMDEYKAL